MKIVITMAGESRRFKERGIGEEKWRLRIKNKSMFEWAISSLEDFYDEKFIFVAREKHEARNFVRKKCRELGIEKFEVVEIDGETDGQATTALKASRFVDDEESFAIYNIDTYVETGGLERKRISGAGHIPFFPAQGDRWSFVKTDSEGKVTEVAEKNRISNQATPGFYYFRSFEDYRAAYNDLKDEVKEEYGEVYVAPLYEWFIEKGKSVTTQQIERKKVNVLGTPEDVLEFWPSFEYRGVNNGG